MGMSCNSIKSILSRHADRELGGREQTQVEMHIHDCPACAAQLQEYYALNSLLAAPEPISPSPWLWTRIRQLLIDSEASRRVSVFARLRPVLIPVAGAALVVLAIVTAGQLSRTITVGSRDTMVQNINSQPDEGNVPVQDQGIPPESQEEDTLDSQE